MEIALDIQVVKIIDAEELLKMAYVNHDIYECPACREKLTPCSYKSYNKQRPHFRADKKHLPDCDFDGEAKLVEQASKKKLTNKDGFPCSFPNRLQLTDVRQVVNGENASESSNKNRSVKTDKSSSTEINISYNHAWTAHTIRSFCKTFAKFPYDRSDLPLSIEGIKSKNYQGAFRVLKSGGPDSIEYFDTLYIRYAPLSFKCIVSNDDRCEIILNRGEWNDEERLYKRPYKVYLEWKNWSDTKRKAVLAELEITQKESSEEKDKLDKEIITEEDKKNGWIFFLGEQDKDDPSVFYVTDHRLICSFMYKLIYPTIIYKAKMIK